MGTELAITMAQTWRKRRIFSAASTVETGITPYPACAKTAFRMGANTLSAEIERTDGRIVLSRRLTLAFSVLVCPKYCPPISAKASKKNLNFYEDRHAALELHTLSNIHPHYPFRLVRLAVPADNK